MRATIKTFSAFSGYGTLKTEQLPYLAASEFSFSWTEVVGDLPRVGDEVNVIIDAEVGAVLKVFTSKKLEGPTTEEFERLYNVVYARFKEEAIEGRGRLGIHKVAELWYEEVLRFLDVTHDGNKVE